MFMPFSLGKNQNRTIWSENKIRWRNYCKVRFHCFLSMSSFRVSLLFFSSLLLETDEMEEVQESRFVGKHGHNLASYREILVFIFSSTQQGAFPGTYAAAFLVSFSGAASTMYLLYYVSLVFYLEIGQFQKQDICYDIPILVKIKFTLVKHFSFTVRHPGSFCFWGSSHPSVKFTPKYRE